MNPSCPSLVPQLGLVVNAHLQILDCVPPVFEKVINAPARDLVTPHIARLKGPKPLDAF